MKTIAVIAQKGGAGKTTIALHLAVCATRAGLHVALIDTDPQASADDWNNDRSDENQLDVIRADVNSLGARKAQAETGGADLLVIDTAPHSNRTAAAAAGLADLVLAPCRPARFDTRALPSSLTIAGLAKTPAVVVLNAVPPRSRIGHEAAQGLKSLGAEVCPVQLTRRAAYEYALIDGRAVHEYEPGGKAAEEIDKLYAWIKRRLELKKRKR